MNWIFLCLLRVNNGVLYNAPITFRKYTLYYFYFLRPLGAFEHKGAFFLGHPVCSFYRDETRSKVKKIFKYWHIGMWDLQQSSCWTGKLLWFVPGLMAQGVKSAVSSRLWHLGVTWSPWSSPHQIFVVLLRIKMSVERIQLVHALINKISLNILYVDF